MFRWETGGVRHGSPPRVHVTRREHHYVEWTRPGLRQVIQFRAVEANDDNDDDDEKAVQQP